MENLKQNISNLKNESDNRKMLLDSWKVFGRKKEDMFAYLEILENATKIIPGQTNAIQIFTLDKTDLDKKEFVGYRHGAEYGTIMDNIPFLRMRKYEGMTTELANEIKNKSKMFILIGNDIFFTTKKVLPTLAQRAGSSTGKFASLDSIRIRFHRDAGYVAYMQACPSPCNILLRKYGDAKKIFAVFSDGYAVISQKELLASIMGKFEESMGTSSLYYVIDNFNTVINMEFPDFKEFLLPEALKEDVAPGILVQMSDTGDSSFSVTGILRVKTGICYVPASLYTRKHTKNASVDEIAADAFHQISSKLKRFPKLISDLYRIQVSNIEETVKKVTASCGIKTSVSAKAEAAVINTALDSISRLRSCTAYDIAASIIEACDFLTEDTCEKVSEKFHSCSVKALLYKYDQAN